MSCPVMSLMIMKIILNLNDDAPELKEGEKKKLSPSRCMSRAVCTVHIQQKLYPVKVCSGAAHPFADRTYSTTLLLSLKQTYIYKKIHLTVCFLLKTPGRPRVVFLPSRASAAPRSFSSVCLSFFVSFTFSLHFVGFSLDRRHPSFSP